VEGALAPGDPGHAEARVAVDEDAHAVRSTLPWYSRRSIG
jgi:hypothetical protein